MSVSLKASSRISKSVGTATTNCLDHIFKKEPINETRKQSFVREKLEKCNKIRFDTTKVESEQMIVRYIDADGSINYLQKAYEDFTNSLDILRVRVYERSMISWTSLSTQHH